VGVRNICRKMINRELRNRLVSVFRFIPDEPYLKMMYYIRLGKKLNLKNPKTFNEKLQWLKLHDRNPEYTSLVDKYEVKKIVGRKIGNQYIIPTLGVWDSFDDIDFSRLPKQFVLKCTHDSGGIVIVRDKSKLDIKKARRKINQSLKTNYYYVGREWPYKNVKPRIIAEKYMEDNSHAVPEDYKIYCFHGKPKYIAVFHNRFSEKALSETVYDVNWKPQHISLDNHFAVSGIVEPKPACMDEMLDICGKLCAGYPQVRIDFYIVENQVYFGEITLYTADGFHLMTPEKLDKVLGCYIKLPRNKRVSKW